MEGWAQEEHHGKPTSAHTAMPIQNVTTTENSCSRFVLSMVFGSQSFFFYKYRLSKRQTWYAWNVLGLSSQIDFILTRAKDRRNTTDARAKANISLDTDHRPVITTLKQKMWRNKRAKHRSEERINVRVLNKEETKQKFGRGGWKDTNSHRP